MSRFASVSCVPADAEIEPVKSICTCHDAAVINVLPMILFAPEDYCEFGIPRSLSIE